jgi:phage gpG-like protein
MSAGAKLTITHDTLSPAVRKAIGGLRDTTPVVKAMCLAVQSVAQRAFSQAALRAAPWPVLHGGGEARLRRSGELWKGIHITDVTAKQGLVAVNKVYGAIHQFGGTIRPKNPSGSLRFMGADGFVFAKRVEIPARPFLPFAPTGEPTDYAARAVQTAVEAKVQALTAGAFKPS